MVLESVTETVESVFNFFFKFQFMQPLDITLFDVYRGIPIVLIGVHNFY